jgi:lipoyl(octanoyl) transferase
MGSPRVRALSRAEYVPTLHAMREFTQARDAATEDEFWVVEHPPVFTLGQAGKREHLLAPGEIPVVQSDRGGQVTYHGPGQVVVYPLIDLRRLGIYVKELVFRIEQSVIQVLDSYGIVGRRVTGAPGIYVCWDSDAGLPRREVQLPTPDARLKGLAKIAALGIKVTRGATYHGVALNVAMDLAPFARINPCGYAGLPTIDLATLGVDARWDEVADRLVDRLASHLAPRA